MRQFRFETKKLFTMAFFALSLFAFVGCDDDDDDDNVVLPDTNGTIVEVASQSANFSLLVAAITKVSTETDTDVATLLSGDTEYTVFAPTNAAFNAAGFPNEAAIEAADADVLLGILTYHVITGEVLSPNVPAGPNAMQNTLAEENIFLTNNDAGVFVNGNAVTTANIQADNGVIHEIGAVLIPSGGSNIAEIAGAEPDFSELLRVIQYVDDNTDSDLAGALSDAESTFTVFAPTNAAFIAALDGADGSDTNNAIEEAELDALGA
ncbi:MAG: fasciclin domain-containing protein, partial [Bacteroidota bacterium]